MYVMKIIPIICCIFFLACGSGINQEEETLKKEIMDIHDQLMPKMDNIYNLKKALQKNRDFLTSDSLSVERPKLNAAEFDSLVQALENADKSMMSWMRNYTKFDDPEFNHQEQMDYLQKEKVKIETVRLKMISSMKEAEMVLEEALDSLKADE